MKSLLVKITILILLLLSILYVNLYYELFALNINKGQDSERRGFRIMTYNVNASLPISNKEQFKRNLIDEIETHKPDILCLQELSAANFKFVQSALDSIFGCINDSLAQSNPYRYYLYSKKPLRNFQTYQCRGSIDTTGFDSLSKIQTIYIRKYHMPVYSADIEVEDGKWVTVLSCHLQSSAYTTARRSMSEEDSWWKGIPLYYQNQQIGKAIRLFEAERIRAIVDSVDNLGHPVIVAGDLNDFSGSQAIKIIEGNKLEDSWWKGGFGFGFTFDAWHLKLRLDHILYSHQLIHKNTYISNNSISDHKPLYSDFETR